jgi:hypothetical protein
MLDKRHRELNSTLSDSISLSKHLKYVLRKGRAYAPAALTLMTCFALTAQAASASVADKATNPPAAATAEPTDIGTPQRMRLISEAQYFNSLAYIFGADIKLNAHFAPFRRTDGLLEAGAASAGVTAGQLEQFQQTAAAVAEQVVNPEHRNFLIPCKPASETAADTACATKFLKATGRLLYRRPLSDAKVKEVVNEAGTAADKLKDFYAGLTVALEGMLISPDVLLIAETSEPDPSKPGHRRLDAYSLASRLSFFLWNAAPDDALLRAAETGEIHTKQGHARVVDMMLASPRLEAGVRASFDDMFGFDDFDILAKDPAVYPQFTGETAADAREQTLRTLVDQLVVKKGDYRDLFTTRDTFMSPALAAIYHVPAPPGWTPYKFPENSPRIGLLTQISFLAVHSHPARSSPTQRGKALRELVLCQNVPRPPPNVDFSLIEDPKANFHTARERLTAHRNNPVCAGCHKIMDPMGLALENFDGSGQYRDNEKGAPIDASGNLDGHAFNDVIGLGQALHDHPALPACLVKRLYSYGTGGPTSPTDTPELAYLNSRFADEGYRLPGLLRSIALSNAFSAVAESQPAAPAKPVKIGSAPPQHDSDAK